MDGEVGVTIEKMDSVLWRDGSEKDGEDRGLHGEGRGKGEEGAAGRGGKSTNEVRTGTKAVV